MADLPLADIEAQALTEAALRVVQRKLSVSDCAVSAFVQNIQTQAAVQALINLIKRKNLVSTGEIDKALAAAYHDARAEAEAQGLVAMPVAAPHQRGQ
jgi:hypothetical protein